MNEVLLCTRKQAAISAVLKNLTNKVFVMLDLKQLNVQYSTFLSDLQTSPHFNNFMLMEILMYFFFPFSLLSWPHGWSPDTLVTHTTLRSQLLSSRMDTQPNLTLFSKNTKFEIKDNNAVFPSMTRLTSIHQKASESFIYKCKQAVILKE